MKRICSLCLTEQQYYKIKKYKTHPLQLCNKCQDAIAKVAKLSMAEEYLSLRLKQN